jgi:hypothetical protein
MSSLPVKLVEPVSIDDKPPCLHIPPHFSLSEHTQLSDFSYFLREPGTELSLLKSIIFYIGQLSFDYRREKVSSRMVDRGNILKELGLEASFLPGHKLLRMGL